MKKPVIYATGNERLTGDYNVSYYIVEKSDSFLDWLGELLENALEIPNGKFQAKYHYDWSETLFRRLFSFFWIFRSPENIIPKEKIIKKMIDLHEKYESGGNRLDVFYGHKKVYLTFRKDRETRKKVSNFFASTSEWVKVEQIKEAPFSGF